MVIGGSNSMMAQGYLAVACEDLEAVHRIPVGKVENLALGGTSCFMGLAQLCRTSAHRAADVLLIEYALNDSASFTRRPDLHDQWARAYEGVIRKARAENPHLVIVSVILGQQNGAHRRRACRFSAFISFMSSRYGAHVIDVNEALLREEPDLFDSPLLYRDVSHYATPAGTGVVGRIVARDLAKILDSARRMPLPRPFDARNYAHARYVEELAPFLSGPTEQRRYTNSAFDLPAFDMRPSARMSFRLNGRVLLLRFVSHPASASLMIAAGKSRYVQHTTRATFRAQSFSFLQSAIMPELHGNASISAAGSRIDIEVMAPTAPTDSGPADGTGDEASGFLIPPISAEDPRFAMLGMLCCGVPQP